MFLFVHYWKYTMAIHPTPNLSLPSYHLDVSDLETLLMMVQNERVRLLDQQLAMQVDAVKARNNQVAHLNKAQTALNKAKQLFSADDKPDAKFKDTKINDKKDTAEHKAIVDEINKAFEDAGMSTRVSVSGLKKHEVESLIQETKADRKSTRLNSSHVKISYAVFCLKKK